MAREDREGSTPSSSTKFFRFMKKVKKGDKLYVKGSSYISRGSDDIAGGLATIRSIIINEDLPYDDYNKIMVTFEEIPGVSYNLTYLFSEQEKFSKIYKDQIAHPDPDIDTPWIEKGDIVNGKPYNGSSIW